MSEHPPLGGEALKSLAARPGGCPAPTRLQHRQARMKGRSIVKFKVKLSTRIGQIEDHFKRAKSFDSVNSYDVVGNRLSRDSTVEQAGLHKTLVIDFREPEPTVSPPALSLTATTTHLGLGVLRCEKNKRVDETHIANHHTRTGWMDY